MIFKKSASFESSNAVVFSRVIDKKLKYNRILIIIVISMFALLP